METILPKSADCGVLVEDRTPGKISAPRAA